MDLTVQEIASLKGQGIILQNDKDSFTCRIITENGTMTSSELRKVADVAEKYGESHVSFTTRLTIEVRGIKYKDIENFKKDLKDAGLYTGGTGKRVRPVVSCKGTVCTYGLIDTQELNKRIHDIFYLGWREVTLPHKFKISIGGCPNNCVKPDLNDLGIRAQRVPVLDTDICRKCGKCIVEEKCRMGAVSKVNGEVIIDRDKCINCGKCIENCYFKAMKIKKEGVNIFLGGRWGKFPKRGYLVDNIFTIEEGLTFIEKAILLFKDKGNIGERFGQMIDRIGFDKVEKILFSDDMIERKKEILSK